MWLVVCDPIVRLHYFLFANGKFFSHRGGGNDDESITVLDLVGAPHNHFVVTMGALYHLVVTMGALSSMLMDASGWSGQKHLRLLYFKLGPLQT